MDEKDVKVRRQRELKIFMICFDLLAIVSVFGFLGYIWSDLDWSAGETFFRLLAFVSFVGGIFSFFGLLNLQAFYRDLDAKIENGKEVLLDTENNRRYRKLQKRFIRVGVIGLILGALLFILF